MNTNEADLHLAQAVRCKVELYGVPRILAGTREVEVILPLVAAEREVSLALAQVCPGLIGRVLREDGTGLHDGYVLNLNGLEFLDRSERVLNSGDVFLLISSLPGG